MNSARTYKKLTSWRGRKVKQSLQSANPPSHTPCVTPDVISTQSTSTSSTTNLTRAPRRFPIHSLSTTQREWLYLWQYGRLQKPGQAADLVSDQESQRRPSGILRLRSPYATGVQATATKGTMEVRKLSDSLHRQSGMWDLWA